MIAIVDYGVGNIFSLRCSFEKIGENAVLSGDADVIRRADKIILPGVGAFGDAAMKLASCGLWQVVIDEARSGKPLMGICLGMQLLFDKSYEYGEHAGLGLIHGCVKPIADVIPAGYKIPHIGWNALDIVRDCPLLGQIKSGEHVYFVHSFYATDCENDTVATTEYGAPLTAAVASRNIYGMQFHPEKSGDVGLRILKAFCEL